MDSDFFCDRALGGFDFNFCFRVPPELVSPVASPVVFPPVYPQVFFLMGTTAAAACLPLPYSHLLFLQPLTLHPDI